MDTRPIGIFDSGAGGLTVIKYLNDLLINEDIIYLGDNKNCPYGNKSIDELKSICNKIIMFFKKRDIKYLIVACNTITSTCLDYIKSNIDVDVIGPIIPTINKIININKDVVLLATNNTIKHNVYGQILSNKQIMIDNFACPNIVNIVEKGKYNEDIALKELNNILKYQEVSNKLIVLGCTHYDLWKEYFSKVFKGKDVDIISSSECLAEFIKANKDNKQKNSNREIKIELNFTDTSNSYGDIIKLIKNNNIQINDLIKL